MNPKDHTEIELAVCGKKVDWALYDRDSAGVSRYCCTEHLAEMVSDNNVMAVVPTEHPYQRCVHVTAVEITFREQPPLSPEESND